MPRAIVGVQAALWCLAAAHSSAEGNIRGTSHIKFLDVEYFNRNDVDNLVAQQMAHDLQNASRLLHLRSDLEPIFRTLAKTPNGGLSHQATRYALFRFFLNERSWLVKGLEPEGTWKTQPERLRKAWESWVPSYLQQRFEQAKQSEGASLEDLVEIAAVIEDLVFQESQNQMAKVFESLDLPLHGFIRREQASMATDMYLLVVLTAQNLTLAEPEKNRKRLQVLHRKTDLYATAITWLRHLEDRILKKEDGGYSFSAVSKVAEAFGTEFPSFNDKECSDLKARLVSMEGGSRKPGRIPLTDFYRSSAYRHWRFSESPEYLRDLGVLDESDPYRPHVILANYISSYNNCMRTSGLYAICCRSVCGDMMSAIEQQVAGPSADASQLAQLVAGLAGTTGLDSKLRQRLDSIAAQSGGRVPLHGRLFAQFLHHVFPRDCPYPHEAGTTNPQTPDDWTKSNGRSITVSQEQLEKLARDTCPADVHQGNAPSYCQSEEADLPWSNSEDRGDLLNTPKHRAGIKLTQSESTYQAVACSWFPTSKVLAWLVIPPAFVVAAYAFGAVLGRTALRWRYPAVVPALVFLWLAMVCVILDLIDIRAALAAGVVFLKWRILVSRFLPCPVGNKSADMEV